MKIVRNGIDIELTDAELYDAWHEKQEQYYTDDISETITEMLDGMSADEIMRTYGRTEEQIRAMIPQMVSKYWDYNDFNELISEVMWNNRQSAIGGVLNVDLRNFEERQILKGFF